MSITYLSIAAIISLTSFLPALGLTHWSIRGFDFIRIQSTIIQVLLLLIGFLLYSGQHSLISIGQAFLIIAILYQSYVIVPYLPIKKVIVRDNSKGQVISMISVNVLQTNQEYGKLIDLVNKVKPDILLTMETNQAWENALGSIESAYSYIYKIPKENMYGMHFYTNLKVEDVQEHYFVTDDRPAIEVHLKSKEDKDFIFWGIHPPPPSPTEKPTSKQKDAELMRIAKVVRGAKYPSIVAGDFNNVCWSRSSRLFAKLSNLEDSRLGRGIHGSFPVAPLIFRIPIDLLFSSKEIDLYEFRTLNDIGSDHFPVYSEFGVTKSTTIINHDVEEELIDISETIIEEGEKAVKMEE